MFAHLKLANQFATSMLRNSKLGYVSSTFEVALEQVLCLETLQLQPLSEGSMNLTKRQTLQVRFTQFTSKEITEFYLMEEDSTFDTNSSLSSADHQISFKQIK